MQNNKVRATAVQVFHEFWGCGKLGIFRARICLSLPPGWETRRPEGGASGRPRDRPYGEKEERENGSGVTYTCVPLQMNYVGEPQGLRPNLAPIDRCQMGHLMENACSGLRKKVSSQCVLEESIEREGRES